MFAVAGLRDFGPSIFGKANTLAQILAVMGVLVSQFYSPLIVVLVRQTALYATMGLTVLSALHYVMLSQRRMDEAALRANP
jgi:cardiolipin synthase